MRAKRNPLSPRLALPLWLLSLLGLDLLFRATYGYVGGANAWTAEPLLFTLLWLLLFAGLVLLLPRWGGRTVMLTVTALSCLLCVVHAVMFHLFGNFFGIADLLYAGDGAAFFSLQYLQMRRLLLIGVLLALAVGILAAIFLPKHKKERRTVRRRVIAGLAALVVGVGGLFWMNRSLSVELVVDDTMRWEINRDGKPQAGTPEQIAYTEFKNPNLCLPLTGLYQYTARDLWKTFVSGDSKARLRTVEELNAWCEARPPHADNDLTGALKGKNLVMIMVESLDTWMLREDVTPNLCALRAQSVDLTHHYTPLYLNAGTFATEFCSLTGIIPPISGVSTDAYVENALPAALPQLFVLAGYRTDSFHSAYGTIYNRAAIHRHLGFGAYHDFEDMGMQDYMRDSQMLKSFRKMVTKELPFFSYIITYSGHGPYTAELDNIAAPHLERARTLAAASGVQAPAESYEQYVRALAHVMETDDFIGGFMERLEAEGLADDTAVIVYGDHYCKYLTDTDFLLELKGVENRNLLCNTPLFLWSRDLEPRRLEKYTSTVDLFPTICNLFDLDADLRCFVGSDIFSGEGGFAYWRDGSVCDANGYLDGARTGSLTPEQQALLSRANSNLERSWNSFRCDWFTLRDPLLPE